MNKQVEQRLLAAEQDALTYRERCIGYAEDLRICREAKQAAEREIDRLQKALADADSRNVRVLEARKSNELIKLDHLRKLEPGWDSYKAPKIDERAIVAAEIILNNPGQAVPTVCGGVQIEWHGGGWDVEIELDPDGRLASEDGE